MVASNVGAILMIVANIPLIKDNNAPVTGIEFYVVLQFVAGLLRDVCFNIAHWQFAFEYYQSAVAMPFIFKQEEMPARRKAQLELMNRIFLHVNLWMPLVYYIVLFYDNWMSVTTRVSPS